MSKHKKNNGMDFKILILNHQKLLSLFILQVNQQLSELRLARSLIAERELEVQRVRNTNDQVCPMVFLCHT